MSLINNLKKLYLYMLKVQNKKLILTILFTSYLFVFGHSVFPHDHHEEDVLITTQFHHGEDHSQSDNFKLPDVFQNYYHPGEKEIFTINPFSQLVKPSKTKFHSNYNKDDILVTGNSPPYILLPPDNSVTNIKKILYSYSGLRAPPLS